jgi:hypothetical protein
VALRGADPGGPFFSADPFSAWGVPGTDRR